MQAAINLSQPHRIGVPRSSRGGLPLSRGRLPVSEVLGKVEAADGEAVQVVEAVRGLALGVAVQHKPAGCVQCQHTQPAFVAIFEAQCSA